MSPCCFLRHVTKHSVHRARRDWVESQSGGECFTWGNAAGGRLGLGSCLTDGVWYLSRTQRMVGFCAKKDGGNLRTSFNIMQKPTYSVYKCIVHNKCTTFSTTYRKRMEKSHISTHIHIYDIVLFQMHISRSILYRCINRIFNPFGRLLLCRVIRPGSLPLEQLTGTALSQTRRH